jgi:hypothetical protein
MASAGATNYDHLKIYLDETFKILCSTTLNAYELEGTTFYNMFNGFFEQNPLIINNSELCSKLGHLPYSRENIKTIIKFLIMKMINPPILDNGTIRMKEVKKYIPNVINLMIEVIFFLPEILDNKSSLDLMLAFLNELVYAFSINTISQYIEQERENPKNKERIQLQHIYMMDWFKSQLVEMMGVAHKVTFFKINLPFSGDIYDSKCLQLFDVKTTIRGCNPKLTELKTKNTKVSIWKNHPNINGYYFIHSCTNTDVKICFTKSNISPVKITDRYTYSFDKLKQNLILFISHLIVLQKKSGGMSVLNKLNEECGGNYILNILQIFSEADVSEANEDKSYFINIKTGFQNISIPKEVEVKIEESILQCETIPFEPVKRVNREDEGAASEKQDKGAAAEEQDEGAASEKQDKGAAAEEPQVFNRLESHISDAYQQWQQPKPQPQQPPGAAVPQQPGAAVPQQPGATGDWRGGPPRQQPGATGDWRGGPPRQQPGPAAQQQPPRELCRHFSEGRCRYGPTCRYIHDLKQVMCETERRGAICKNPQCPYRHKSRQKYFYDKYLKYKAKYMKLKELL